MSNAKDIRKQVRNVAQEMLPTLLTQEALDTITKSVVDQITSQLNRIESVQKNLQAYIIRNGVGAKSE